MTHVWPKHTCRRSLAPVPAAPEPSGGRRSTKVTKELRQRAQRLQRKRVRDASYSPSVSSAIDSQEEEEEEEAQPQPVKRLKSIDTTSDSRPSTPAPSMAEAVSTDDGFVRILLTLEDVQYLLHHVNAVLACFRPTPSS